MVGVLVSTVVHTYVGNLHCVVGLETAIIGANKMYNKWECFCPIFCCIFTNFSPSHIRLNCKVRCQVGKLT